MTMNSKRKDYVRYTGERKKNWLIAIYHGCFNEMFHSTAAYRFIFICVYNTQHIFTFLFFIDSIKKGVEDWVNTRNLHRKLTMKKVSPIKEYIGEKKRNSAMSCHSQVWMTKKKHYIGSLTNLFASLVWP